MLCQTIHFGTLMKSPSSKHFAQDIPFLRLNKAYEKWLRSQCSVVEDDLIKKHQRMTESPLTFLRATYFSWASSIDSLCPDLAGAPKVLAVGDLHIENFGTWRDGDGRLVWGVNDFDEAAVMPYPWDLVRLATSAGFSPTLAKDKSAIALHLLEGYAEGLESPTAAVLDQKNRWMRRFVESSSTSDLKFWESIEACPIDDPPNTVRRTLKALLPKGAKAQRFARRSAGGGSLGRPRYIVIANWQGAKVVREAKALVPSAWYWYHGDSEKGFWFDELSHGRFRSRDPSLHTKGKYVYRRLAPDARKLDLELLADHALTSRLLKAMGRDLGAVHAASGRRGKILADFKSRDPDWLERAAEVAAIHVRGNYQSVLCRHRPKIPCSA
jgi:hypothetical protein